MRISPTTPHGWLLLGLRARLDRARAGSERGVSTIEWVVIIGVLMAIAATVGGVIYTWIQGAAEDLEVPDPPSGG